jgi:amino acid permease
MQNENKLVNPYNYIIIICLAILIILIVITPIWQFFTEEQVENLGVFPYIFLFLIVILWLSKRFYKNFSDDDEIIIKAYDLCYTSRSSF